MARHEAEREDLLRDATAYVERAMLSVPDFAEEIFVGFRRTGDMSLYVDQDPVYHFNASGQLRRAFWDGTLLKAEHGRLVRLTRERTAGEVHLCRQELSETEAAALCERVRQDLATIRAALAAGSVRITGQVPPQANPLRRFAAWLGEIQDLKIASAPNVGR